MIFEFLKIVGLPGQIIVLLIIFNLFGYLWNKLESGGRLADNLRPGFFKSLVKRVNKLPFLFKLPVFFLLQVLFVSFSIFMMFVLDVLIIFFFGFF